MNLLIISSVLHIKQENQFFGYAPYVCEMNIWAKHVSSITVVAPILNGQPTDIDMAYHHENIEFIAVQRFSLLGISEIIKTFALLPKIMFTIFTAMSNADHVHLRCPSNMGLLGCIVQIFYPKKPKSAKYAGNWDYEAKKPFSYKLQQWILNNAFLTRNMQVMAYGEWQNTSKNIVPFFTATYSEKSAEVVEKDDVCFGFKFIFVGMLVRGKNPLYAIQLVEGLHKIGKKVSLELYGEGAERQSLQNYIENNGLQSYVFLKGNQNGEIVKMAYKKSHFVLLPSLSEGWPKAIAEGMFWGCVPVALPVSCVPQMLDFGNRGLLLHLNLEQDLASITSLTSDGIRMAQMSGDARNWSQKYTTEKFENAIKNILHS